VKLGGIIGKRVWRFRADSATGHLLSKMNVHRDADWPENLIGLGSLFLAQATWTSQPQMMYGLRDRRSVTWRPKWAMREIALNPGVDVGRSEQMQFSR
jgi:hypothetical protein